MWLTTRNQVMEEEMEIEGNKNDLLCEMLEKEHMTYSVTSDSIIIHTLTDGLMSIEDGIEVDVIASLRDGFITIQLDLIKLNENEQNILDPLLLNWLMKANYITNMCKFGFSSYGLSLSLDFDVRDFKGYVITHGFVALLEAMDIYSDIIYEWFDFVEETLNPNFKKLKKAQAEKYIEYLQKADLQKAQIEGNKETEIRGLIMRIITGFVNITKPMSMNNELIPSILGVPKKSIEPLLITPTKDENQIF